MKAKAHKISSINFKKKKQQQNRENPYKSLLSRQPCLLPRGTQFVRHLISTTLPRQQLNSKVDNVKKNAKKLSQGRISSSRDSNTMQEMSTIIPDLLEYPVVLWDISCDSYQLLVVQLGKRVTTKSTPVNLQYTYKIAGLFLSRPILLTHDRDLRKRLSLDWF